MKHFILSLCLSFFLIASGVLLESYCLEASDTGDEWSIQISEEELTREELFFRLEEDILTVSTLLGQRPQQAPSIVYVVTAKEIKEFGVRTVYDLLQLVPGFDVLITSMGQPEIGIRGVISSLSNNVLVLQDGYRLNEIQTGSPTSFNFELPVENIKRIEIIRGPGSTLFGSNALTGVINIITKDPEELQGLEISAGGGTFDTRQYSMTFGHVIKGIYLSGFVQYLESDGPKLLVEEDALTPIDRALAPFGIPPASRAPGYTYQPRKGIDANVTLSYQGFTLHGKFKQEDTGNFIGANSALVKSENHTKYYALQAEYSYPFWEKGELTAKFRWMHADYAPDQLLYPPGFTDPRDLDGDGDIEIFPEGMVLNPRTKSRRISGELVAHYTLFDTHDTILGIAFDREETFDSEVFGNFDPMTNAALDGVQPIYPDLIEANRDIWAIFAQDTWEIAHNLSVTGGVRFDDYSDFGDTLSPRGALVWGITENFYLKLLYGKAFRAPTLYELYGPSGSGFMANRDLSAETIHTIETAVGYNFRENIWCEVNGFYNSLQNLIRVSSEPSSGGPGYYKNTDDVDIWGVETWLKTSFETERGENNYLFVNYTYQSPQEKEVRLVDLPPHLANIGINVAISRYLNINTSVMIRGKRSRTADDQRKDVPSYALVNTSILLKNFLPSLELSCTIQNLLDEAYVDPSPSNTVPGDFPRPGRSIFLKAAYRF